MPLTLSLLPETFAICRLDPATPVPAWALGGGFTSVTYTPDELSILCPGDRVPPGLRTEAGWRCFKVEGPFDFSVTGVLASLATPLADAGISVFVVCTYDTDYLFVKEQDLGGALVTLAGEGHILEPRYSRT